MRMPVAVAVLGMASGVAAASAFDPLSNVCLLTIMTQERLASLHRMLLLWDGWVSIAMLVEADEYASVAGAGPDTALRYRGRSVAAPERVALALVSDVGYRAPSNRFPYNLLRNAALRGCEATYVFAVDVDFVPYPVRPSARLRSRLEELEVRPGSKNVLVVAAFEQVGPRPSEAEGAALDKPALRQLVGSGDLISFASAVYERGHECDQVHTFLSADTPFATEYRLGCEPYTIVPRADAHAYEETFVGYGKDRVSWNYELAAKRAAWHVVPDVFLVHFNTYDEAKPKAKYGHFPTDWLIGESCWPPFRDRVAAAYNYSHYTCHQASIDAMSDRRLSSCVAEAERVCVAPYCVPPTTTFRPAAADPAAKATVSPGRRFMLPPPPPPAPVRYPGPAVVMLGCEGCGVIEMFRTLSRVGGMAAAGADASEPSWRDRQVNFFDVEARFLLGQEWYLRRWPLIDGGEPRGIDGSGSYLHSSEAMLRLPATLQPSTTLLVLLRDPAARAALRWRELRRRQDYARGATYAGKLYAEASALLRCIEPSALSGGTGGGGGGQKHREAQSEVAARSTGGGAASELSSERWEKCALIASGLRSSVVGGGIYEPQLRAWFAAARAFRWVVLPAEALAEPTAAHAALDRLGLARPECVAQDLSDRLAAPPNSTAAEEGPVAPAHGRRVHRTVHAATTAGASIAAARQAAEDMLRAFFARYNGRLAPLLVEVDPESQALWRAAAWLPRGDEAEQAIGATGRRALLASMASLRAALVASGEPPEASVVGAGRWLGSAPRPRVFLLGPREAAAEALTATLHGGQEHGTCVGALSLFDDDTRYLGGLARAASRLMRRADLLTSATISNGTALGRPCAHLVDTTAYLHTRWAAARIRSALPPAEQLRFVAVLRDPAELALRHWRALRGAVAARLAPSRLLRGSDGLPGAVRRGAAPNASRAGSISASVLGYQRYFNGSTLARKVRDEATAIRGCLRRRGAAVGGVSFDDWKACTTLQCNWMECLLAWGMYAPQLRGWLGLFSPRQFLLLEATQLTAEPRAVAAQLADFMQLPPLTDTLVERIAAREAAARAPPGQSKQAMALLRSFYADHNPSVRALFETMARPGAWRSAGWLSTAAPARTTKA